MMQLLLHVLFPMVSKRSLKTLQKGSPIRILKTFLHKCFFIVESIGFNKLWLALFPMIWSTQECNDLALQFTAIHNKGTVSHQRKYHWLIDGHSSFCCEFRSKTFQKLQATTDLFVRLGCVILDVQVLI